MNRLVKQIMRFILIISAVLLVPTGILPVEAFTWFWLRKEPTSLEDSRVYCGTPDYNKSADNETARDLFSLSPVELDARLQRLKTEIVLVRLRIVIDRSLVTALGNNDKEIHRFVRNLVFAAQLYYERKEMKERLRFNFRVVDIVKSKQSFPEHLDSASILEKFEAPLGGDRADLNVLLLFRNLWSIREDLKKPAIKTFGLAYMSTFCNLDNVSQAKLIMNANSLGSSMTLVHEIGHALGARHDPKDYPRQGACSPSLMFTYADESMDRCAWSEDSLRDITNHLITTPIYECTFKSDRTQPGPLKSSVDFDFTLRPGTDNKRVLPGSNNFPGSSPLHQCELALGKGAYPDAQFKNQLSSYEMCKQLGCRVYGLSSLIHIGPAAPGTRCRITDKVLSHCKDNECSVSNV